MIPNTSRAINLLRIIFVRLIGLLTKNKSVPDLNSSEIKGLVELIIIIGNNRAKFIYQVTNPNNCTTCSSPERAIGGVKANINAGTNTMKKTERIILFNVHKSKINVFLINAREGVELTIVKGFNSLSFFLTGLCSRALIHFSPHLLLFQ